MLCNFLETNACLNVRSVFFLHVKKKSSVVPKSCIPKIKLRSEAPLKYELKSKERTAVKEELKRMQCNIAEIPVMIGGQEIKTDVGLYQVMPFKHNQAVARFYYANCEIIQQAIETSTKYQQIWDRRTTIEERCKIWEKAAKLMAGEFRQQLNAAAILGQGKTLMQAENDTVKLIDFFRMNAYYMGEIMKYKPISPNGKVTQNHIRYRGNEGFVSAVTPFDSISNCGNLAYTPVLAGNTVVWKPIYSAMLSNWLIYKILLEAGLPADVVSFVPACDNLFSEAIIRSPHLAGISYGGSYSSFKAWWKLVSENLDTFLHIPTLVGECSGKNFHLVHESADVESVVACTVRSAFEYSGQKSSSCSRMYVPASLWGDIKSGLIEEIHDLRIGDPRDFSVFTSAVIDCTTYNNITRFIECAKESENMKVIEGGNHCNGQGYFVEPTIIEVADPLEKIMTEEYFGPLLPIYVYEDAAIQDIFDIIKNSSYALTCSIFGEDKAFLSKALQELKMTAGTICINDKSTGSVVGQQPSGGCKMSGPQAGGPYYILRWTIPQTIKETFTEQTDITYSYMEPEPSQKADKKQTKC